jgi:hypothetical protein
MDSKKKPTPTMNGKIGLLGGADVIDDLKKCQIIGCANNNEEKRTIIIKDIETKSEQEKTELENKEMVIVNGGQQQKDNEPPNIFALGRLCDSDSFENNPLKSENNNNNENESNKNESHCDCTKNSTTNILNLLKHVGKSLR